MKSITFYFTLQALYNLSTDKNCLKEGKRTQWPKDLNNEPMTWFMHCQKSYFCMQLPLALSVCTKMRASRAFPTSERGKEACAATEQCVLYILLYWSASD